MSTVLPHYFASHCDFDVTLEDDVDVAIELFKVPGPAHDQLGDMAILWGDGHETQIDCKMSRTDLETMTEDPTAVPSKVFCHTYDRPGLFHVRVGTASGFLPLKALPYQTTAITSPLPTLITGETDHKGKIIPSDTMPALVAPAPQPESADKVAADEPSEDEQNTESDVAVDVTQQDETPARRLANLMSIPANLFVNNEALAYFDRAFAKTRITTVPSELFSPVKTIASAREIFAGSALTTVPAGLFSGVTDASAMERAFADCLALESVENPFTPAPIPVCSEGLLAGAPLPLFAAFPREIREDLGCVRPAATIEDEFFAFRWHATQDNAQTPQVLFYPTDFTHRGDFFIEWGDGTTENADWTEATEIRHIYENDGVYRIVLHFTTNEPVRPFRLGRFVTEIETPLPEFFPRNVAQAGNFCGWCADARELTSLPEKLFEKIADTVTNLDEAFAGCTALVSAPDDLFDNIPSSANADGAFAFCKKLAKMPTSYSARNRRTDWDYFVPSPVEPVKTTAPKLQNQPATENAPEETADHAARTNCKEK